MKYMIPKIKICGLTNLDDAEFSADAGAVLLGVVLSDKSPRKGNQELVKELSRKGYPVVGVYTEIETVEKLSSQEDFIQLHFPHNKSEIDFVHGLKKKTISVVFPDKNPHFMKEATEYLEMGTDLVLIDFGREIVSADTETLSGIRERKIGLAGKISLENLPLVVELEPYFIDLSSKLEKYPGKKDHEKIRRFMEVFRNETAAV